MSLLQTPPGNSPAPHSEEPHLSVWIDHGASTCELRLRGDLCAATIAVLESHVDLLGCCQCEQVIIDLAHLEQLDQTGARVLLGLQHYVSGRGGRLELTGATAEANRTLRVAIAEMTA